MALETASMTPAVESFDAGDRLSPGQLLCGRFLILRRLGRGGMSEVYECTDLELGIAVAAKVLRSSLARRPEERDLLRRELLLARRITHPNVCRLFELFVDEGATGNVVIVMELLDGVTLSQRLRGGPLPGADEALRILTGIAAGLGAVHAAGVVHRDLKSSNVQLVDSPSGARPVLTDFGIAKEALDDGAEAPRPPGTLPYMAPEVRRGAPATTAADVFAFGVLALEVLTGERASRPSGEAPDGSAAAARLRARGVGVGWRRLIRRCLALDPADRPLDGTVLLRAVERLGRRWPSRYAAATAVGLVALAALALPRFFTPGTDSRHEAPPPFTAVAAGERVSIVFGGLRPSRAADGPFASSLSQLLEGNLAAGDRALVRSSQKVRKLIDLESSDRSLPGLRRIAKALDGDFLVLGDVRREAGRDVDVELRLIPADERAPSRVVRRSGDLEELFDLAAGLAADLRHIAGIPPVTAADLAPVVAMQPASPQAQMLYGQGMEHMLHGDLRAARLAFEGAVKIDGRFALARAGLADVFLRQGKRAAAAQAASQALALANRLPRVQQLSIEALVATAQGDDQKARSVYEALWLLYPDEIEHGLALGLVQIAMRDLDAAEMTVRKLRSGRVAGTTVDEARVDLLEAQVAGRRQQLQRWRTLAERALARLGSDPLLAPLRAVATHELAEALKAVGDIEGARARLAENVETLVHAESPGLLGDTWSSLAMLAARVGDDEEAEADFERAIDVFSRLDAPHGLSASYRGLARLAFRHGDLERTAQLLGEAIRFAGMSGDPDDELTARNNLAILWLERGQLKPAAAEFERVVALARSQGDPLGLATYLGNLGVTYLALGRHEDRLRTYAEAARAARRIQLPVAEARRAGFEGELALASADLTGARRWFDAAARRYAELSVPDSQWPVEVRAALAHLMAGADAEAAAALGRAQRVADAIGHQRGRADVALAQADMAVEQGRFAEARALAESAVSGFRAAGNSPAEAELMLAKALSGQGAWQGAADALARARRGGAEGDLDLGLRAELIGLRLDQRRTGRCAGGAKGAEELAAKAHRHGFHRTAFEARLLAADCARSAGEEATASRIEREVKGEAERTGWRRFAIPRHAVMQ